MANSTIFLQTNDYLIKHGKRYSVPYVFISACPTDWDSSIQKEGWKENPFCRGVLPPLNDGTEYKTTLRLSVNLPSQIIARVSKEVPAGAVTVIVHTKLTGSNKTLKEVREIIFKLPCTAKLKHSSPLGEAFVHRAVNDPFTVR